MWGAQGENCANYLSKGRAVAIDGRLEWREWEAQDGSKREAVEVSPTPSSSWARAVTARAAAAASGAQLSADGRAKPDPVPAFGGGSEGDDDIPF